MSNGHPVIERLSLPFAQLSVETFHQFLREYHEALPESPLSFPDESPAMRLGKQILACDALRASDQGRVRIDILQKNDPVPLTLSTVGLQLARQALRSFSFYETVAEHWIATGGETTPQVTAARSEKERQSIIAASRSAARKHLAEQCERLDPAAPGRVSTWAAGAVATASSWPPRASSSLDREPRERPIFPAISSHPPASE